MFSTSSANGACPVVSVLILAIGIVGIVDRDSYFSWTIPLLVVHE